MRPRREDLRITQVLNTHWHPDHTGGNDGDQGRDGLHDHRARPKPSASARSTASLPKATASRSAGAEAVVWDIPAHTAGHIAYYFEDEGMIFVGDTMFAMGCGRLFEGTAEQMYANMQRIAALPDDVRIYCGHEYTLANARFAAHAEPGNRRHRAPTRTTLRRCANAGQITLPTTVAEERATNPFVRASDAQEFARLRAEKDSFR